jgi:hypothetical protein
MAVAFSNCLLCFPGDIEVLPKFGPKFSKRYVALTGLIIGVGEILGQICICSIENDH